MFEDNPRTNSATYSSESFAMYSIKRVELLKKIGRTPVANGSNVPPCPAFLNFISFCTSLIALKDVTFFSLLRIITDINQFHRLLNQSSLRYLNDHRK